MPELAGVLAAQESALERVVATLTTHVRDLLAANARQAQRVQQLERTQGELLTTVGELRQEAQTAREGTAAAVEALRDDQRRVEQQLGDVQTQATTALESEVARIEAFMEARLQKSPTRKGLSLGAEEAVQSQIELLDKKFDYLSRVKLEIKDLTRKVENQEQVIDGMKIGMELLSKSIGADEGNSEGNGEDNDESESDSDMSDIQFPAREIPQHGTSRSDFSLSFDRLNKSDDDIVTPQSAVEEVHEIATPIEQTQRPEQRSSLTIDDEQPNEIESEPQRMVTTRKSVPTTPTVERAPSFVQPHIESVRDIRKQTPVSLRERTPKDKPIVEVRPSTPAQVEQVVEPLPESPEIGTVTVEQHDAMPEVTPPDIISQREEIIVHDDDDDGDVDIAPLEEEAPPESNRVSTRSDIQETVSATEDDEPLVEEPSSREQDAAVLEHEEEPAPPEIVEIEDPSDENEAMQEIVEEPPPEPILEEEPTQHDSDGENNVQEQEAPMVYRQRTLSHQKQIEETAAMFQPASMLSSRMSARVKTSRSARTGRSSLNASASALIRGRRQERNSRRQPSVRKDTDRDSSRYETDRPPLSAHDRREVWQRVFAKLIQLRRLNLLQGSNSDKALFRKQNISVGARVRRLEESASDTERAIEMLESNIQANTQGISVLDEVLAQYRTKTGGVMQTIEHEQKSLGKSLVGVEEKVEILEQEIRRMRSFTRRGSTQGGGTSILATQVQEIAEQLSTHEEAFKTTEELLKQVAETDIPALQSQTDVSLRALRTEMERKLKDWVVESEMSFDKLSASILATDRTITSRLGSSVNRVYCDMLAITSNVMRGADLAHYLAQPNTERSLSRAKSPLFVSMEALRIITGKLVEGCTKLVEAVESPDTSLIAEYGKDFMKKMDQLQVQTTQSMSSNVLKPPPDSTGNNNTDADTAQAKGGITDTSNYEEHLVRLTLAQLQNLESFLGKHDAVQDGTPDNNDPAELELPLLVRDAVVQMRSVMFLLYSCRQASSTHQEVQELQTAQATMSQDLTAQGFVINQIGSTVAMVKLMNTRLDSFMEMSFSFAKDDDVKKSIEDMINASNEVRDRLTKQFDDAQHEAVQRDATLERELNQLISRVNKKLDKDELLWTQEVLERQLQSVAKASLGEEDLADIHRLLQRKLDRSHFNALLQDQRAKTAGANGDITNWLGGGRDGSGSGQSPLVGAKCISCQGDLPPSKAMIKSAVKEELQHEIAKSKAQQQVAAMAGSSSSFSTSNHRNIEKFKTEMLLSTLQKKGKK